MFIIISLIFFTFAAAFAWCEWTLSQEGIPIRTTRSPQSLRLREGAHYFQARAHLLREGGGGW